MKNICIGIIELNIGWEIILDQIGVWYEEVDFDNDLSSDYSVIIVNQAISGDLEEKLHQFNDNGGSILEPSTGDLFSHARFTTKKKVKRLINTKNISFLDHIPFLDVYGEASLYNGQDNFGGIIDFEKHEQGMVCNLGIDPSEMILDNSYSRKRFFFQNEMNPDELVSNISKGFLADLIVCILKELHFQQGIPFVCKWVSPKVQPIFAFRIDSDYGDQESIKALYEVGKKHEIPMTWFLHVEAHEEWISLFHEFEGQEIALHGYEHGTSNSYEHIFNNIEKGLRLLNDVGFEPKGFCVPYGIWNDALDDVLQKFEFEYTSEFTVGYDALPFPLSNKAKKNESLQIPIHPICTGSLNRKHANIEQMQEYFEAVMKNKLARYEPILFYHHPLQTGLEIWNDIFTKVNKLDLTKLSFSEYSAFWKLRSSTNIEASINPETKELVFKGVSNDLLIQVSKNHTSFELIRANENQEVQSSGEITYTDTLQPTKDQIDKMNSNKFQLLKISLLDKKNRKRL